MKNITKITIFSPRENSYGCILTTYQYGTEPYSTHRSKEPKNEPNEDILADHRDTCTGGDYALRGEWTDTTASVCNSLLCHLPTNCGGMRATATWWAQLVPSRRTGSPDALPQDQLRTLVPVPQACA